VVVELPDRRSRVHPRHRILERAAITKLPPSMVGLGPSRRLAGRASARVGEPGRLNVRSRKVLLVPWALGRRLALLTVAIRTTSPVGRPQAAFKYRRPLVESRAQSAETHAGRFVSRRACPLCFELCGHSWATGPAGGSAPGATVSARPAMSRARSRDGFSESGVYGHGWILHRRRAQLRLASTTKKKGSRRAGSVPVGNGWVRRMVLFREPSRGAYPTSPSLCLSVIPWAGGRRRLGGERTHVLPGT